MSEIRSGVIIRMNVEEEKGTIMDENCQDIHFQTNGLATNMTVGDKVCFKIQLGTEGLMATNIHLQ